MEGLHLNKNYFTPGGVLGRWDFLKISILYAVVFTITGWTTIFVVATVNRSAATLIATVLFFVGSYFYLTFINLYKRLRDIRGTTQNELVIKMIVTACLFLPVVGVLMKLWLIFMPGKITSMPENHNRDNESGFSSAA